jgi:hypothetical protein
MIAADLYIRKCGPVHMLQADRCTGHSRTVGPVHSMKLALCHPFGVLDFAGGS